MNFLLDIGVNDKNLVSNAGFFETFGFGGQIFLIGLVTVFSVLIILLGVLVLFKLFFHDMKSGKKTVVKVEPAPAPEPVYVAPNADEEIIAVIAAAIAMAESETQGIKFKVVSFKRK